VALVADKNAEFCVKGLLSRPQSLGIHRISVDIFVHPESDPGCLLRAQDFLRPFWRQYDHALVMLDREGSGRDDQPRTTLEADLEERLFANGWANRAAAIVVDPELDAWVWSDSPEVDAVLGWAGRHPPLRSWLRSRGFILRDQAKPTRPKETMEEALQVAARRRSSAIYLELAKRVSVERCVDPAFLKLKGTLQRWFGSNKRD